MDWRGEAKHGGLTYAAMKRASQINEQASNVTMAIQNVSIVLAMSPSLMPFGITRPPQVLVP